MEVCKALGDVGVKRITKAIDCEKTRITYAELIDKTNEYLSHLEPDDVAFVYCAVHGMRYQNEHVLLAADSAPKTYAETSLSTLQLLHGSGTCCGVCTRPDYVCTFTPSICIHGSIAQRGPRTIVIVLDSCRQFVSDNANTAGSEKTSANQTKARANNGINILSDKGLQLGQNSLIAYACAPNDTAADTGTYYHPVVPP